MHFQQTSQLGYLNPDRSITGLNAYADGVTGGNVDGAPYDNRVDLNGKSRTWSLFATDTVSIKDLVHVTLSGRYNQTTVENRDNITPGGGSGSLDGDHRFSRFNPAIGVSVTPSDSFNFYAGYNEGSRTPTAIELGCADPANPCKLPNAMAGDPPLKQVVTKTFETGFRGGIGTKTHWNVGVFRAENHDDILFVGSNASGFGYFKNFGQTRRQGIEIGADTQVGDFSLSANYTYQDATFQSNETLLAEANSSADANGNIAIQPGNRMPLIPHHIIKAHADWRINSAWSIGMGMLASSSSLARGNENGQHQADGTYFVGSGKSAGYTVFDLSGKYRATKQLSFFAQVNNLFDRKYTTAAQLGATGFTASSNFIARPFSSIGDNTTLVGSTFYAPGASRTFWAGVRYEFGK
jgi:outer membrane receptor protein involved in Fe transport